MADFEAMFHRVLVYTEDQKFFVSYGEIKVISFNNTALTARQYRYLGPD